MSLGEHLVELRRRLTRAALGIVFGLVVGWILYDLGGVGALLEPLIPGAAGALQGTGTWKALSAPIFAIAEARGQDSATLNFTNVTGALDVQFQVAFATGLVLSSPIWLYQLFAFFVPGLTRRERRYTFAFVFSAIPLFLAGCAAGWFVLPRIVEVMSQFVPAGATTFYDVKYYLDFVLKLMLAVGVAFVLPVFLVLLNFIGVIRGRSILLGWRWAVLTIVVFTALATPAADVLSMVLLAIPMAVLYFAAVGIALWHDRVADRRTAREFDDPPA